MNDLIEQVSAAAHQSWMDGKRAKGVESRLSETGEELMVPYDQLSDAAKDLDRVMVKGVLDILPTVGYGVVAVTGTPLAFKRLRRAVQEMREEGEHDLRSVLGFIDSEANGKPIEFDDDEPG